MRDGNLDGSFASAPLSGSIADDQIDCYTLSSVSAGDRLLIGFEYSSNFGANPYWSLREGNGNQICSQYASSECAIEGAPGWTLEVRSSGATGTFSYALVSRRLTNPQGCSSLGDPATWSFAAPRTDGTTTASLGARCYTFARSIGEPDGSYWFRTVRSAGNLTPVWSLYGPSGARECQGSGDGINSRCQLLAVGNFALVVGASGANQSGSFFVTARRLTAPDGCGPLPPLAIGATPTSGSISTAGKTDCYSLSGLTAADAISVSLTTPTGSNQSPRWSLVDASGIDICDSYFGGYGSFDSCQLSGSPGWTLVVYDAGGAGTFSYSLAVRRLTDPQGCSPLGEPAALSFAAPRINGQISGVLDARCYTFTRAPGEEDGNYWMRAVRTSGTLGPFWSLYGPSGSRECQAGENEPDRRCRLLASGTYVFLIADNNEGDKTGTFFATAKRLTSPAGCSQLSSVAFESAPVSGDLSSGGSVDCHSLPDLASGDSMSINFFPSGGSNPNPRWTVIDANGNVICDSYSYGYGSTCTLSGTPGWSLLVYDAGAGSFSYSLAVRRLTDPEGCTSLGDPAIWSFTAPRINGTIDGSLAAHCYTFTRAISDPDGAYWFRTLRQSGTLGPQWNLYGPTGSKECGRSSEGPEYECRLLASGTYALVINDGSGNQTGTYLATAKNLTAPTGCAQISSILTGTPSLPGSLTNAGEVDCYMLPAGEADEIKFDLSGAAERFTVIGPDGKTACGGYYQGTCLFSSAGPYYLLLYAGDTGSGNYHYQLTCNNPPCGQTSTAVTEALPSRLGQSRFASLLLHGHDLALLEEVDLLRRHGPRG